MRAVLLALVGGVAAAIVGACVAVVLRRRRPNVSDLSPRWLNENIYAHGKDGDYQ